MKSVMFISLGFYDYDAKIREQLNNAGFDVTQFTPMGNINIFEKVLLALTKETYLAYKCRRRQKKYMLKNNKKYDYVFVVVGRHLDTDILEQYRAMQKDAKFILYLWDDVARVERFEDNKKFYDEIYSFDTVDVANYGFKYLPLFYTDEYEYKGEDKKYILNLSGRMHSARLSLWDKIVKKCNLDVSQCHLFMIGGSIKNYLLTILPSKDEWMKPKYIHMRGKSQKDMAQIMKESKVALDVQFGSQSGLTIRTIESVAARTKLITTNPYVKEYDFYNPANICVVDKDEPVVPDGFFDTVYQDIPESVVESYSLANWIDTMFKDA
ncbi:MAG: hypothetical protein E7259_04285 [Lachnospiraceae bacterium]|nr:hypothetical protein [Lachnospiraceae bacterium]